jgi:hypothetical protein
MKAYLINPTTKTIEQVNYSGEYHDIYKLCNFDIFTLVTLNGYDDGVFIDDEGLLKEGQDFFYVTHESGDLSKYVMLAGCGLVLGCDADGNSVEPRMTIDELRSRIHWANPMEAEQERSRLLSEYPKVIAFDTPEELLNHYLKGM